MFDFFVSIATTIQNILTFIIQSIGNLVLLFVQIPKFVSFLSSGLAYLPSVVIPFTIATISIYVIFLIIDR